MQDNFSDIKPDGLIIEPVNLSIKNKDNFQMGTTMNFVLKIVGQLFESFFSLASPEIKDAISKFVIDIYDKAKVTPNPWDDYGIKILATILNINLPND